MIEFGLSVGNACRYQERNEDESESWRRQMPRHLTPPSGPTYRRHPFQAPGVRNQPLQFDSPTYVLVFPAIHCGESSAHHRGATCEASKMSVCGSTRTKDGSGRSQFPWPVSCG
jgi:hypothetical protein